MKLLLTFSAVLAVALCNAPPTNFQQSQNFNSEQFQTNQFQSQSFNQQAQQQQIKLNPSSNLGQSNQYLPPPRNNPGFNNNRNNPGFNNNRNNPGFNNNRNQPAVFNNNRNQNSDFNNPNSQAFNNPNNPSFNNPSNPAFNNPNNRGPSGPGGFQQNQAQSININGNQFQGNQAQQAYGNKLDSHQNQHQNQQANFPSGLGNSKYPNSNQNFQNQNKNRNLYHSESHNAHSAASASSSSKFEHQQGFKAHGSSMKHHNSQYNSDDDIIRNEASPDGSYAYSYDTSDGTSVEQSGYIKNPGARSEDKILSVKGSYSYIAPEGDRISVSYIADELGYRATSIKS